MANYIYCQCGPDKNAPWKPMPVSQKDKLPADAVFITVLAVSKLVDGLEPAEKDKLAYEGPLYLDWDSTDIVKSTIKVNETLDKLEGMGVDLSMLALYATGKKGYHAEVPQRLFLEKVPKGGIVGLPLIYKDMVFNDLAVDTLDLKIYSSGKGRMWRIPNVKRPDNGLYKVPLTVGELRALAPTDAESAMDRDELRKIVQERYDALCSAPRPVVELTPPEFNVDLHLMYATAKQKVEERLAQRAKRKRDPQVKQKATLPTVKLMMRGQGLKPGVGFHSIALQVTIAAVAAGMKPEDMIEECKELCENHVSDGDRYNTPEKRRNELLRLYDYMLDNPSYEFSVGAIKSILIHEAPDLDNLPVSEKEVAEGISEAVAQRASDEAKAPDEYDDVTGGVTLSKFGVYIDTENGKKRVCAVSFRDVHLLHSMETGMLTAYEAEILVNGKSVGRQTMEMDVFASLQIFNRFCARLGHAMQGAEQHVRGLMMRFVEEGKKRGKLLYITKREGLDVVNIPNHPDEKLREPFMVYSSAHGVYLEPRVKDSGLDVCFQGFPDPRGIFKTDLTDAPPLAEWVEKPENQQALRDCLGGLMQMQKSDVVAKMIGWYTACFYRMLFHRAYSKFPLLHVNGPAGSGKSEMNMTMASFFYYNQEPKTTSPASSLFAILQHMAASASVPLIVDEYKPQDLNADYYSKIRLAFRDAYNCRDMTKGGGTRESDDYRTLHHTQLSAPTVFIAEAAEEEAAVAERVVLVTIVRPPASVALRQLGHFNDFKRNHRCLAILGSYMATEAIQEYSIDKLKDEFDPLLAAAQNRFLMTAEAAQKDLSDKERSERSNAKERSVFNYTVAKFGFRKFRNVVEAVFGKEEFNELLTKLEGSIYDRMGDLAAATQPEWAKVMLQLADMSWNLDLDSPYAIRYGKEYAILSKGGKDVLELNLRVSYLKYRGYAGSHRSKILFSGDQQFMYSMKDCAALMEQGTGKVLAMPNIYSFDVEKLKELGVNPFKPPKTGR